MGLGGGFGGGSQGPTWYAPSVERPLSVCVFARPPVHIANTALAGRLREALRV